MKHLATIITLIVSLFAAQPPNITPGTVEQELISDMWPSFTETLRWLHANEARGFYTSFGLHDNARLNVDFRPDYTPQLQSLSIRMEYRDGFLWEKEPPLPEIPERVARELLPYLHKLDERMRSLDRDGYFELISVGPGQSVSIGYDNRGGGEWVDMQYSLSLGAMLAGGE